MLKKPACPLWHVDMAFLKRQVLSQIGLDHTGWWLRSYTNLAVGRWRDIGFMNGTVEGATEPQLATDTVGRSVWTQRIKGRFRGRFRLQAYPFDSQTLPISVVAPDLHRGLDIQREWGRAFQRAPRIPQAGIVVMGNRMADTALIERFQQAYAQAMQWCRANADECGRAVAKRIDMLTPEGVADAVRADGATLKTAAEAREELEFFFKLLHARQPGLVGGKLPPDDFYQRG